MKYQQNDVASYFEIFYTIISSPFNILLFVFIFPRNKYDMFIWSESSVLTKISRSDVSLTSSKPKGSRITALVSVPGLRKWANISTGNSRTNFRGYSFLGTVQHVFLYIKSLSLNLLFSQTNKLNNNRDRSWHRNNLTIRSDYQILITVYPVGG